MAIEEAFVVLTISRATDQVNAFPFATKRAAEAAAAFFADNSGVDAVVIQDYDEPEMEGPPAVIRWADPAGTSGGD